MPGRVFSVAVSRDGKRIAAGSSLDGTGTVHVYSYEFDTALPANIKQILSKVVTRRSREENETLAKYVAAGQQLLAATTIPAAGVYAVAFHPDRQTVAAAGADGKVRLIDSTGGAIRQTFDAGSADRAAQPSAAPPTAGRRLAAEIRSRRVAARRRAADEPGRAADRHRTRRPVRPTPSCWSPARWPRATRWISRGWRKSSCRPPWPKSPRRGSCGR